MRPVEDENVLGLHLDLMWLMLLATAALLSVLLLPSIAETYVVGPRFIETL